MAWGVNSILNMGVGALSTSQANIQTTGNNISNVDTEGYSRQKVVQQDRTSIDGKPGQIGQGVEATQVIRYFDKFIESAYLDRATMQSRYQTEYNMMRNVETLFNESSTPGIGSALSAFFDSWNDLASETDTEAARAALLETARTLASSIRSVDSTLKAMQEEMNVRIREDVATANSLIKEIADLNREINIHTIENRNNANQLLDLRDEKVRQLSNILDLKVEDRGAGNYNVLTSWGYPLVQQDVAFSLEVRGPQVENNLVHNSKYTGTVGFDGLDSKEYTMEVVKGGGTYSGPGTLPALDDVAQYKVSLDGGKTWIMDENTGQPKLFYATTEEYSTQVNDLQIYFTAQATPDKSPLSVGDKFVISPKDDVYWVSPTSDSINISSQAYANGLENTMRITGGTLGAALDFRDNKVGEYIDRIKELSDTLTWEVNRLHSQGSGLETLKHVLGDYQVGKTNVPLGSLSSGFKWSENLQSGNMSFVIYNSEGKPLDIDPLTGTSTVLEDTNGMGTGINVFGPNGNFDPSKHSLEDVVNAINSNPACSPYMQASIVDNRLQLSAKDGYSFGIMADSTGLAAGLGINTFFEGDTPGNMAVRGELANNTNLINAGRVNGGAEGNVGDNITAKEIAALATKVVSIGGKSQSITDYYAGTVTKVGAETRNMQFLNASETAMTNELKSRKEEISGVNLDEEMSNLIKFQSSYKAAAKLITTADEMIQVLLSLKQ